MNMTLRGRVIRAGIWTSGGFAAQKVFQLASNLVLTRLLFPEAFGLMSLANVALIALNMFSDTGIRPAIVQGHRGGDDKFLNTAWTIQIIRGFVLWAGACVFAYPASFIYKSPVLWPLISLLGLTSAINGFSSISLATCERELKIRRLTIVQFLGQVVTLTITALMAWKLRSVWALVFGGLAGAIVSTSFSHILLPPHRHTITWDKSSAEALVKFGRWIFISTAFVFTAGNGLRMLQGILLTASNLGVLSVAQTISTMPTELIAQVVAMAVFPALSEARRSGHERMLELLRQVHGKILLLSIATFSIMAMFAIPVINTIYDSRYRFAGVELTLLSLNGVFASLSSPYQNTAMAMGHTKLSAGINCFNTIFRSGGLLIGFNFYGMTGMLIGIAMGSFLGQCYVMIIAKKIGILNLRQDVLAILVIILISFGIFVLYGPTRLYVS